MVKTQKRASTVIKYIRIAAHCTNDEANDIFDIMKSSYNVLKADKKVIKKDAEIAFRILRATQ